MNELLYLLILVVFVIVAVVVVLVIRNNRKPLYQFADRIQVDDTEEIQEPEVENVVDEETISPPRSSRKPWFWPLILSLLTGAVAAGFYAQYGTEEGYVHLLGTQDTIIAGAVGLTTAIVSFILLRKLWPFKEKRMELEKEEGEKSDKKFSMYPVRLVILLLILVVVLFFTRYAIWSWWIVGIMPLFFFWNYLYSNTKRKKGWNVLILFFKDWRTYVFLLPWLSFFIPIVILGIKGQTAV